MITKIYNVFDHGNNKKYKFMGALNSDLSKVFDRFNKGNTLSESEKNMLKQNYGKNILSSLDGFKIVDCYLYDDDSINTIKKKISVFCDDVNNYNDLHLWGKFKKISYSLENEFKNFIFNTPDFDTSDLVKYVPNVKMTSDNRDEVHLNLDVTLGTEYRIESGVRVFKCNPLSVNSGDEVNFKDIKVDTGAKLLTYYGEIENNTIHMMSYNGFINKVPFVESQLDSIAKYFFPNHEKEEGKDINSYLEVVNDYENICNGYIQKINDDVVKSDMESKCKFLDNENLTNIVISVGLNLDKELDLDMMFAEIVTNKDIPFVKYKDPSRNSIYKINDDSVSPGAKKILAKDDFTNYKTYFTPFIIGYYSPEISLETLESWKNNKYSLKEKNMRKNRKAVNLLNDLGELTLKVKVGDDYYTLIVRNNGTIYIQLFDMDFKRGIINKLIESLLTKLKKNGLNLVSNNVTKLDSVQTNFKFLKYDVERDFVVRDTEIPLSSYNLGIIENKAKELYPYCFVTYDSENTDVLLIKYIRVSDNESNNNYINFFMKLQASSKKLGVDKFRKLWEEKSRLIFNLSSFETNAIFDRVIEQVQEENIKKEGAEVYATIAIKLKDQFEDNLVYNVNITNVADTNELNRIQQFVQYIFYIAGTKQRKKSVSLSPVVDAQPEIKLQEVKQTTFADEDELDFDDEFEEESDEEGDFEYEYESGAEGDGDGEVVTLPETTSVSKEKDEPPLPEQKLNLAKLSFRKYMGDMRKIKDNKLFNYPTSKIYEQYSRICGSSDMRQPIILTRAEYNNFKIKNLEGFNQTSSLEWGSSASSINYYICPRIWCIRDKVALTPKQLVNNGGRCPFCNGNIINLKDKVIGEDNTLIIRKGGSNNYWKTTQKKSKAYQDYKKSLSPGESDNWNLYLKETEKDAYPGLLHPKQHPNKLCMPCCNTELHKEKNFDKCRGVEINYTNYLNKNEMAKKASLGEIEVTIKPKDLKEGYQIDGKYIHRGDTVLVLNQIADYRSDEDIGTDKFRLITEFVGVFEITKSGSKKITKFTNLGINLEKNMSITITSGTENKDHIFTVKEKAGKFVFGEPEPKDEADKSYIIGAEKFPIDVKDKYGFLSDNLNKLFKNSLNGIIEKGKITSSKKVNLFLRKGVDQNYVYSFLSSIASIKGVSINGLIKRVVENLTPEIFVSLNCGELVKLFGVNPEELFDKNLERSFVKWCGVYGDFVKEFGDGLERVTLADVKIDNEKITRLIVVYFAFEYFKKYLADLNIYKDIDYLWDLFSRKVPGLFDEGLNIVIIEDGKTKLNLLCPNVDDSSMFYSVDKPTSFLLKRKDENGTLYEPIVLVNYESGEITDTTMVESSHSQYGDFIETLIKMVKSNCVSIYPKNQSSYGFKQGKTIDSVDVSNIKTQILDDYMKGVGVFLKNNTYIYTESFAALPGIPVTYKRNIKAIEFDKFTDIVKTHSEIKVNKYIIKGDDVVGVLTSDGNIYKIKSKKSVPVMDITKKKTIDYSIVSKSVVDEREIVVSKYERKKRQYEQFITEVSNFFKKNNRGLVKTNFYKIVGLIVRNRLKTMIEKKIELIKVFTQLIDNITERVKSFDNKTSEHTTFCVISSKNECLKTKKCKFQKGNRSFKLLDSNINKPNCLLKIEESYYKLFINKLVDQILRSNIKRNLIFKGRYRSDILVNETIVKTDEYSGVLGEFYSKNLNLYLGELPKPELGKVKTINSLESSLQNVDDEDDQIFATTIGWNNKDYKLVPNIQSGECKFPFYKKVKQDGKLLHKQFMKCIPYKVDGIDAGFACPTKTGKFGVGVEWGFCPKNTPPKYLSTSLKPTPKSPSHSPKAPKSPSHSPKAPKSPSQSPKAKKHEFTTPIAEYFLDTNFEIINKPPDGDCFFHSVADALPSNYNMNARKLREIVVSTVSEKELNDWTSTYLSLNQELKNKKATALEKQNTLEALQDYKHLKGAETIQDLKRNMMNKSVYWANDWAITMTQLVLKVKIIILDNNNYETDPQKVIKCDIDGRKNVTRCSVEGCGMTHEEITLQQQGLLSQELIDKYTHDGVHVWEDVNVADTSSYDFNGFVIVEYNGSHYNLVSHNRKTFFSPGELPSNLVDKINMYCINTDTHNNNIFSKIKGILTKKKPKKIVRKTAKKAPVVISPTKLGVWVDQPNKAVLGSFKVPGSKGTKGRDTLNEAKRICVEHDGCMGITKNKKPNSKFTLRTGPKTKESPNEDSWIKKDKYTVTRSQPSKVNTPVNTTKKPQSLKKKRVLVELTEGVPRGYTRLVNKAVRDNLKGVQRKKDINYALEEAEKAGDKCSGFVMGRDGKFSLRTGKEIFESKTNEVLYIKTKFLPRRSSNSNSNSNSSLSKKKSSSSFSYELSED